MEKNQYGNNYIQLTHFHPEQHLCLQMIEIASKTALMVIFLVKS